MKCSDLFASKKKEGHIMQTMIRHKWISSSAILSVLLVWLMVWGLRGDGTRAEAQGFKAGKHGTPDWVIEGHFPPAGFGPGRRGELTVFNFFCDVSTRVEIRIKDAVDGGDIKSFGPALLAPEAGFILRFLEDGTSERRTIVAKVEARCPRQALSNFQAGADLSEAFSSLEVVDTNGRTIRRVEGRWTDHNPSDPG